MEIWKKHTQDEIRHIYRLVLKYGWKIELVNVTENYSYVFEMTGPNPNKKWVDDWQWDELQIYQTRRIVLFAPDEEDEWTTQ